MIKFDSNRAWKHATLIVKSNRELVLALAGVFFFLPLIALSILIKQPQVPAGGTPEQMAAAVQPYVSTIGSWGVLVTVMQGFGQLALIELFGRTGRSTVGQALRRAVEVMASYIAFYLLIGFLSSILLGVAVSLTGTAPIIGLAVGLYLVLQFYARFMTTSAVIIYEERLNPITAMLRSWTLTRKNGFRIGNFLFLLLIAAGVVLAVLSLLVGIVTALTLGQGRAAMIVSGLLSSLIATVMLTYFVAVIVAVYRQLAGDVPDQARATFE